MAQVQQTLMMPEWEQVPKLMIQQQRMDLEQRMEKIHHPHQQLPQLQIHQQRPADQAAPQ